MLVQPNQYEPGGAPILGDYAPIINAQPISMERVYSSGDLPDSLPAEVTANLRSMRDVTPYWMQSASKAYKISPNLRDHVLVPVVIMSSDIPNCNGFAFPRQELVGFRPMHGRLGFETWVGKPTHVEHENSDITAARGVILDSRLRPMQGFHGGMVKVVLLASFDRTKDRYLVEQIEAGARKAYSMGAFADEYACSICAARVPSREVSTRQICSHLRWRDTRPRFYDGNKLAYWQAVGINGFELSSVAVPAYASAVNPQYMTW